jgi:L-threonylcarbamoyladenylate synthase
MRFDLPDVSLVAARLQQGHVVAYPTEAVMGLGCDPFNEAAVMRICALKDAMWTRACC